MTPPADPVGTVAPHGHDEAAHGRAVVAALRKRPDGQALLQAAADAEGVHLVGGGVRDLLLGRTPRELDVVVEGDADWFARLLVRAAGGSLTSHDRFGTATVLLGEQRIDVARARRERYPAPGALPEVEPAPLAEDLLRRDFTVNAIAVSLSGRPGTLTAAPFALDDLHSERLRVMHDESFRDDPTRLLRLGRYAGRLGFKVERQTGRLANDALTSGALGTVSGGRIGAELRLALVEDEPLRALASLAKLGVLEALQPALSIDVPLARRALDLLPEDGRKDLLVLAASAWGYASPDGLRRWLDDLEFPARDRDIVTVAACESPVIARAIAPPQSASRLWARLRSRPLEAVALAGALGPAPAAAAARLWLDELRHVRLEIDGHDLVDAGVPEGPDIGRRLELALARKLDGELTGGREAELAAALED
jgi:tRNA nucleotidyltransferase (CCA-adding enzyme)